MVALAARVTGDTAHRNHAHAGPRGAGRPIGGGLPHTPARPAGCLLPNSWRFFLSESLTRPGWTGWAELVRLGADFGLPGRDTLRLRLLISVLSITLALASAVRAEEIIIPAAANTPGFGDTQWRTDVGVKTRSDTTAEFTIELLEAGADNSDPLALSFSLDPGQSARFADLLGESFGFEGTGALRITPTAGDLLVSSRTYNDNPDGTFGQFIPGYPLSSAVTEGETVSLIQLSRSESSDEGYRTNIGFVNVTGGPGTIEVSLYSGDGVLLGTLDYPLVPYGYMQANDIFATVDAGDLADGYAMVSSATEGMAFFVYASVVDNRSGDAIFIPAQVDVEAVVEVGERFAVFEIFFRPG